MWYAWLSISDNQIIGISQSEKEVYHEVQFAKIQVFRYTSIKKIWFSKKMLFITSGIKKILCTRNRSININFTSIFIQYKLSDIFLNFNGFYPCEVIWWYIEMSTIKCE